MFGVSFFDGVHLLRRGFVDQDHRDGGGQAFEQLVQQGLRIFRPPQDQDMLRRFNGFQTFLLAKLAFNEDRGHGGGHERQAENAYHHEGDAHHPAQAR